MGTGGVGGAIRLVLSDVDGTLLTADKRLTDASVDAVRALHDSGVAFTVTSSRPPQGLAMLLDPLAVDAPVGAFNGGVFVDRAQRVLDQHPLPLDVVATTIGILDEHGVDPWVYTATTWHVRRTDAPHVAHEEGVTRSTAVATPDLLSGLGPGGAGEPAKVVGVSDDPGRVAIAEAAVREALGAAVSATRSQAYYLDVTHPSANKGAVVEYLARRLGIATQEIATIGDGQNDTLMFARSGTSIAMGNAGDDVKAAAAWVTTTNDDDGFARAMHEIVLGPKRPPTTPESPDRS